jgi:hypothetical protein
MGHATISVNGMDDVESNRQSYLVDANSFLCFSASRCERGDIGGVVWTCGGMMMRGSVALGSVRLAA